MQTTLKAVFKSKNGSSLVGAIVICTVMAIGVAGLMGLSRNTISQEVDSNDDAKTYMAAEAGLFVGTSWFKHKDPSSAETSFDIKHGPDSIPVRVEILPDGANHSILRATANFEKLPYVKQLEWRIQAKQITSGYFGDFIDNASDPTGANSLSVQNFKGFRSSSKFDSPTHFNGPLLFKKNDHATFLADVTLYNPPEGGYYNSYGSTTRNDYNYYKDGNSEGVKGGGLNFDDNKTATWIDNNVFKADFKVVNKKYGVEFDFGQAGTRVYDITPNTPTANAFLQFGFDKDGNKCNFCYTFDNGATPAGTGRSTRYYNDAPDPYEPLIIRAVGFSDANPLIVKGGTVDGHVTVNAEDNNASIKIILDGTTPAGGNHSDANNLVYSGVKTSDIGLTFNDDNYNTRKNNNFGVDINRKDLLMFYSGKDIILATDALKYITAQLFARNGQVLLPNYNSNSDKYRVVGVMCAKYWWCYTNGDLDRVFTVFYDQRALGAVGVNYIGGGGTNPDKDADDKLIKTRWRERNISKADYDPDADVTI
jgi:hypothetical protein